MDDILHHFETMAEKIVWFFTGESSETREPGFLDGAGVMEFATLGSLGPQQLTFPTQATASNAGFPRPQPELITRFRAGGQQHAHRKASAGGGSKNQLLAAGLVLPRLPNTFRLGMGQNETTHISWVLSVYGASKLGHPSPTSRGISGVPRSNQRVRARAADHPDAHEEEEPPGPQVAGSYAEQNKIAKRMLT